VREPVSSDLARWIRERLRSGAQGVNGSVTSATPVLGGEVARDRADMASGGLGSPELAENGEEYPTNSLAGLRPRESERRRGNGGGNAPGGSG
jgi:hypothetical protein